MAIVDWPDLEWGVEWTGDSYDCDSQGEERDRMDADASDCKENRRERARKPQVRTPRCVEIIRAVLTR